MAFRILYNDIASRRNSSGTLLATITSSSDGTSRQDSNVADDRIGKVWLTDSDSAEWIKWDLGSASAVTCIHIAGHNFSSAATVVLEGHTAD